MQPDGRNVMGRYRSVETYLEAEQAEFDALIRGLTPDQWAAPSLCEGWTVHDVVVHIAVHTHRTLRETLKSAEADERHRHDDPNTLAALLASPVRARSGWERRLQLDELLIHQQDVRRPLDLPRDISAERLAAVLDSLLTRWVGTLAGVGARKRCHGLRLVATDIDWSHGAGPDVLGTGEALLMAMAGRELGPTELAGDGARTFVSRRPDRPPADAREDPRVSRRSSVRPTRAMSSGR